MVIGIFLSKKLEKELGSHAVKKELFHMKELSVPTSV